MMMLLPYTPARQHLFPQTGRGWPAYDEQGQYVGYRPQCGECRGYGTTYQMRFKDDEDPLAALSIETGYFDCPKCDGRAFAPYVFSEVTS